MDIVERSREDRSPNLQRATITQTKLRLVGDSAIHGSAHETLIWMTASPHPAAAPSGHRPRCYIASPLGFSEAGRHYYHEVFLPTLATVVTPVDPWALTPPTEISEARVAGRLGELGLEIGRRNTEAIRSSALLAALLDGQEPDSGTVAELGYAAALGKTCFGLRSDFRQTGEEGATINLQVETFVIDSGGRVVASRRSSPRCGRSLAMARTRTTSVRRNPLPAQTYLTPLPAV